ncbi:MAG: cob(I)yrinic acid a,c-diamide adenosyltransferase [Chloroflexi bacterium]|nr:cob(I)yrinic acid a,c-diamide adenosyltransferase [Chloroflexota bacterium]
MSEGASANTGRRGLLIVYTGEGKGKTTAALGTVLRAWGHGMRLCVIQFIKSEAGRWGEILAAERLGIEWHTLGTGFVWEPGNDAEARERALAAWALAQEKIVSGEYDLIVLDEFTYLSKFGWLDGQETADWLIAHKPRELHVIITGRDAPEALVAAADLVSEVRAIKHPFAAGVRAQKGIEF